MKDVVTHESVQAQEKEMDPKDEENVTPDVFTDFRNGFEHAGHGGDLFLLDAQSIVYTTLPGGRNRGTWCMHISNGNALLQANCPKSAGTRPRTVGSEPTIHDPNRRNEHRLEDVRAWQYVQQ